mgnify:FL=1
MATIKVQNGQSIFDIALQHCGDVAAAFDIAVLNDILLTDALAAGQSLAIPAVVNTDVVNYYKSRGIVPATDDLSIAEQWLSTFDFSFDTSFTGNNDGYSSPYDSIFDITFDHTY